MMGLSDGRKSFQIRLVVLIQYRLWQTATQPPSQPASHVAVAITLNAKASSLKSDVSVGYTVVTRGAGHMFSEKSQRTQNGTMFVNLD